LVAHDRNDFRLRDWARAFPEARGQFLWHILRAQEREVGSGIISLRSYDMSCAYLFFIFSSQIFLGSCRLLHVFMVFVLLASWGRGKRHRVRGHYKGHRGQNIPSSL
jgi:hypothetical protein